MRILVACMSLLTMTPVWPGSIESAGGMSLYDLHEQLANQDGKAVGLDVHRGSKVLVTMFYGGCRMTCPMIIDTIRSVESKLDAGQRSKLRVLMISFDSVHDTPKALRELADSRRIDTRRWTLMRADDAAVRRIAAALSVQYRRLPDGTFSHANVITVLGANGEILARSMELGSADRNLLEALADR
jgi:protein SCO1/2